ncbi:HEAT repeat domain-containing protein [Terriglobus aquaticus]|uniref:HEAT repeat domain-containing protein n=1 Tax=Terriglobus aquaticus TaxID=940139 RepID=UPI0021E0792A|nr:HEAT repeat domain-containing protein [Terriglobus aquaticus]
MLEAYGELDAEQQAFLALHLHGCPACVAEQHSVAELTGVMDVNALPEISPNLLAQSRMRLDEALDETPRLPLAARIQNLLAGTWHSLSHAPALAALLVGVGFLGGSGLSNYQAAHSKPNGVVTVQQPAQSTVGNVSGVVPTANPEIVEVHYNRVTPETMQGSLDDPRIRQLLLAAAQHGRDNSVREESVSLLATECRAGHKCGDGDPVSNGLGFRDALLMSLRYDKSPQVRLRALEGLQPFVSSDQRVRDVVLESLMRDPNANVRTRAIGLLEPVHADSSVRQVLHTVSTQDENPYIRTASMQALEGADGIQ